MERQTASHLVAAYRQWRLTNHAQELTAGILCAYVAAHLFYHPLDTFWPQMALWQCLAVVVLCTAMARVFGAVAAVAMGYFVVSAIFNSFLMDTELALGQALIFKVNAQNVALTLVLTSVLTIYMGQWSKLVDKVLFLIAPVNAYFTLFQFFFYGNAVGFNTTTTINSALIALTLPITIWRCKEWKWMWGVLLIPCLWAIGAAGGATAVLMLFAVVAYLLIRTTKWMIPVVGVVSGGLAIWIGQSVGGGFWTGWDRLEFGLMVLRAWWQSGHIWLGNGIGSFYVWGPALQEAAKFQMGMGHWVAAHNDWVQLIFEGGLVGLGLMVAVMMVAMWRAWRSRPDVVACLLGGCVFGLTYYPSRQGLPLVILLVLLAQALRCQNSTFAGSSSNLWKSTFRSWKRSRGPF